MNESQGGAQGGAGGEAARGKGENVPDAANIFCATQVFVERRFHVIDVKRHVDRRLDPGVDQCSGVAFPRAAHKALGGALCDTLAKC